MTQMRFLETARTENPMWPMSPRESVDSQPDERPLRVDLVCCSRAILVANGIAS
jgi:hypothetical protein